MKTLKEHRQEMSESYKLYRDKSFTTWALDYPEAIKKAQAKGHKLVGVMGALNPYRDWALVSLTNFDKQFTKNVKLKSGERIYRTVSKLFGMLPLVKVNINTGRAYFLSDRSMSGEIDEPEFQTKGEKLQWMRLLIKEDTDAFVGQLDEGNPKIDDKWVVYNQNNKAAKRQIYKRREAAKKAAEKLGKPWAIASYVYYNDNIREAVNPDRARKVIQGRIKQNKELKPWTKKGEYKDLAKNAIKRNLKSIDKNKKRLGENVEKKVKQHNISVKYGKKGTLTRPPEGYIKDNKGMYQKVNDKDWKRKRLGEESLDEKYVAVVNRRPVGVAQTPAMLKVLSQKHKGAEVMKYDKWEKQYGFSRSDKETVARMFRNLKEETELTEAGQLFNGEKIAFQNKQFIVTYRNTKGMRGTQDKFSMYQVKGGKLVKDLGSHPSLTGAQKFGKTRGLVEEVEIVLESTRKGFSDEQLERLRKEWGTLKKIDPTGAGWKKVEKFIEARSKEELEGLAKAKIKWISMTAASKLKWKFNIKLKIADYWVEEMELAEMKVHFKPKDGPSDMVFRVISQEGAFKKLKVSQQKDDTYIVDGDNGTLKKLAAKLKVKGYVNESTEVDELLMLDEKYAEKSDKQDDGEGLDKVDKKAVKKDFDDRKDKDIDNDGDADKNDKYLHKRRKAVSKAIAKRAK